MSNIYGKNIKISIFGQSHSSAIGVTIDGLPAGFQVNFDELRVFLQRRMPGQGSHTTSRKEPDEPEFLSGLVNGITCGAPLTAIIRNTDVRSDDYEQLRDIPRPSHADYAAYIKYGKAHDVRGGGHFSGRLTAPLCIAGGICLQILWQKEIEIAAHIKSIGNISNSDFDTEIAAVRAQGDSLGGIIECSAIGVPAGIGEPMFDGMENRLASILLGIPAVKGVEFGNGFEAVALRGSENNDSFYYEEGRIKTRTNNHGGILGGITSGMPIIFRVAIKPTASIALEQDSVNLKTHENTKLKITGRHDPCIVPRAVPCVEAAAAIAIYDALLDPRGYI
ncbi:MAG: chorismate synthase [Alphaproteobacteria bacterium]|nr:chorismate synthase [Alphaproteobacteria bacterium]MCL2504756.1 chorismate synthase [Alphaproteobacteria bacterium]